MMVGYFPYNRNKMYVPFWNHVYMWCSWYNEDYINFNFHNCTEIKIPRRRVLSARARAVSIVMMTLRYKYISVDTINSPSPDVILHIKLITFKLFITNCKTIIKWLVYVRFTCTRGPQKCSRVFSSVSQHASLYLVLYLREMTDTALSLSALARRKPPANLSSQQPADSRTKPISTHQTYTNLSLSFW